MQDVLAPAIDNVPSEAPRAEERAPDPRITPGELLDPAGVHGFPDDVNDANEEAMGLNLEPFTLNFDGTPADPGNAAANAAAAALKVQPPSPTKSSRTTSFRQRLCVHAGFSDCSEIPSDDNATIGSSYNDVDGVLSTTADSGGDDLEDTGEWSDDDAFVCGPVNADEQTEHEEEEDEKEKDELEERDPEEHAQEVAEDDPEKTTSRPSSKYC